jgi:hypothetical protein
VRLRQKSSAVALVPTAAKFRHLRWLAGVPLALVLLPVPVALVAAPGVAQADSPALCTLNSSGNLAPSDLYANVSNADVYQVPGGVTSVSGSASVQGYPSWTPDMGNNSGETVTPTITISGGVDPSVFDDSLPTATLPSSCGLGALPSGDNMSLFGITAEGIQDNFTLGFDSTYTVTPDEVALGGGDVTVEATVTLTDPRFTSTPNTGVIGVSIGGLYGPNSGVTLVSLSGPTNLTVETLSTDTECTSTRGSPCPPTWVVGNAQLDTQYVFTAVLDVANPQAITELGTTIDATTTVPTFFNTGSGQSVTIPEPEFDGSTPGSGAITFSVAEAGHSWQVGEQSVHQINYPAPVATVSGSVTDPSGDPFASPIQSGVVVCPTGETLIGGCEGGAIAPADPSGFYSTNLAPGTYNLIAFSIIPGNPTPGVSAVATLPLSAGETVTQDFVVPYPPSATVSGTVTGPNDSILPLGTSGGVPISGVAACPAPESVVPGCAGIVVTGSDASGDYSLSLPPGTWNIAGYTGWPNQLVASPTVTLTVGSGGTYAEDFVVPIPAFLSGTVSEPDGDLFPPSPPSAVKVGAAACPVGETISPTCPGLRGTYANPNGSYTLNLISGISYNVFGFAMAPSGFVISALVPETLTAYETVTQNFVVPVPTLIAYTGPTQGAAGDPVLASATLIDETTGNPIPGQPISIGVDSVSCTATTNASGSAACILVPPGPAGPSVAGANFYGSSQYAPSAIKPNFTVLAATCSLCVLSPTAAPALSITGNGTIKVPGGSIAVNSTGEPAASLTGNATVTAAQIGGPGAPAAFKVTGNGRFSPTPVAQSAVPDPLAALPECPGAGTPSPCPTNPVANVSLTGNGSATISPGIYQSISVTGNGKLTLNPGTYVITGSLSLTGNGSITGSGVSLYFACSSYPNPCGTGQSGASFSLTGNGIVELTAPTSGIFQGVSIFVDRNDTATDTLTGNGSTIGGTIYALSAHLTLTGNGSMEIGRLIVNTLTLTGNGSVTIG